MKSHDWSCDGYNLIRIISYYNLSRNRPLIYHPSFDLFNLLGQPSKSIF